MYVDSYLYISTCALYYFKLAYCVVIYVTLFWKTDHVVTFSISRNTDFKY